jgi:hypothetical protein
MTDLNQCVDGEREEAIEEGYCQCPFCSKESVTDDDLFVFALKKLGVDRDGLVAMYREDQSR